LLRATRGSPEPTPGQWFDKASAWARSRSTTYDQPTLVSTADLTLMRRIDKRPLVSPFAGARRLRDLLR
jgi:hypothetical protein